MDDDLKENVRIAVQEIMPYITGSAESAFWMYVALVRKLIDKEILSPEEAKELFEPMVEVYHHAQREGWSDDVRKEKIAMMNIESFQEKMRRMFDVTRDA